MFFGLVAVGGAHLHTHTVCERLVAEKRESVAKVWFRVLLAEIEAFRFNSS